MRQSLILSNFKIRGGFIIKHSILNVAAAPDPPLKILILIS